MFGCFNHLSLTFFGKWHKLQQMQWLKRYVNELFQSDSDMMGIRMQERDVFVVVNYDFEYITEEGKEVWMKEGEVLLLLSRTNSDWWQVNFFKKHF